MENNYNLDPFSLITYTQDQLVYIINDLSKKVEVLPNTDASSIAEKTVILSDLQMVAGEILARYEKEYENKKLLCDKDHALAVKKHRDQWETEHNSNKFPANEYFDTLALQDTIEEWTSLNEIKLNLTRFKKFYNNYETKINALKKLQEQLNNFKW